MKNFTEEKIIPIHPDAEHFVDALAEFLEAAKQLELTIKGIPSYTGQWNDKHFYKDEQERYNVAANELHRVIRCISAVTNGNWG
jgi:hypothetical protein